MTEVLVLIDAPDGKVTKPSLELLTIARRIGEPSAVVFGDCDTAVLGEYGAEKIYTYDDAVYSEFLVAPKAEALAQLVGETSPAAVLVGASAEGKEISARVALKTEAGWIGDAVDVQADGGTITTTQSVFAGNFTVQASITKGAPVITVKPNSAAPEAAAGAGAVEAKTADISDAAKTARITSSKAKEASGRPELTEAAIVVSGGRGTGGDFSEVEAFADSLGAAVGASRAAVDSGWYPHTLPGRADRQDGLAAAVRGQRHLRRHPAPGRHADVQDDHRGQQGRGGADLRARRLRRRRRPEDRAPAGHRRGQEAQGLTACRRRGITRVGGAASCCSLTGPRPV